MNVALVAAARNEGPYLLEWITWHRMIGFDPIIVYDNGSTDQTTYLLRRLDAIGAVTHVLWTTPRKVAPQRSAFADALGRIGSGWVAFFDLDEFLLLHMDPDVNAFVSRIGGDASGIAIAWQLFGSAGETLWSPLPTVERFTRCGQPRWFRNAHIKSIVRAERVRRMIIHHAELDGFYVNDVGDRVELTKISVLPRSTAAAQLNHYPVRSLEEFMAKIARGRGSQRLQNGTPQLREDPDAYFREYDRNGTKDCRMLSQVPELKRRMTELRLQANIPLSMLRLIVPEKPVVEAV